MKSSTTLRSIRARVDRNGCWIPITPSHPFHPSSLHPGPASHAPGPGPTPPPPIDFRPVHRRQYVSRSVSLAWWYLGLSGRQTSQHRAGMGPWLCSVQVQRALDYGSMYAQAVCTPCMARSVLLVFFISCVVALAGWLANPAYAPRTPQHPAKRRGWIGGARKGEGRCGCLCVCMCVCGWACGRTVRTSRCFATGPPLDEAGITQYLLRLGRYVWVDFVEGTGARFLERRLGREMQMNKHTAHNTHGGLFHSRNTVHTTQGCCSKPHFHMSHGHGLFCLRGLRVGRRTCVRLGLGWLTMGGQGLRHGRVRDRKLESENVEESNFWTERRLPGMGELRGVFWLCRFPGPWLRQRLRSSVCDMKGTGWSGGTSRRRRWRRTMPGGAPMGRDVRTIQRIVRTYGTLRVKCRTCEAGRVPCWVGK